MAVISVVALSNVLSNQRMEAEYYRPDVLRYLEKRVQWVKIGRILNFVQYGTSLPLNEEGVGYKIFRLNEIEDCFLTKPKKWVALPRHQYESLRLEKDDVLFCRTNGNIKYVGRTGILKEDIDAVFASYLVRIKPNKNYILPEYLTIYLNTKVGRAFIERQAMHSNQFNVSAEQLKKIPIPLFDMDFQYQIKELVDKAASYRKESNSVYSQAEKLLLEELRLKDFEPKYKLSYTSNLSQAFSVHRVDAEYFQPAYYEIVEKIIEYPNGYIPLLECVENIKPDFNPKKYPDKIFSYVELADIDSSIGIIHSTSKVKGDEAPSRARRILRRNDVIISSVEGSLEKVALVDAEHEGSLASTGFFQFRPTKILPQVLLVLSKSIVLQAQLKKECAGTILTAVPSESLKRIIIPILPSEIQQEIAKLVQKSHEARKKAKELLEEAKRKVEEAIENEILK